MLSKLFGLLVAAAIIIVLPLLASTTHTANKVVDSAFTGTLVCPGCELKVSGGARAACNTYGHRYALKMADGHYVNFLENRFSEDLMKGKKYHHLEMVVQGKYFTPANLIDIRSFEVDGQEISWCRHCREMDACASEKKDTP
jgi:hypothetical protein